MSLLDHPEAQALLADAVVTPEAVAGQADRLTTFLQRHLPRFYRSEQRATAALIIRGRLGGPERKTSEPIAIDAGRPASRSSCSSARASGTTRPSWPNCASTSERNWPTLRAP